MNLKEITSPEQPRVIPEGEKKNILTVKFSKSPKPTLHDIMGQLLRMNSRAPPAF